MNAPSLSEKRCRPCEGGVEPLTQAASIELMQALHADWVLSDDSQWISRQFEWGDFHQTMAFVNQVAEVANTENHHPDMEVSYRQCVVKWTTHAIKGLSENDFICAAKIDRLVEAP